MPKPKYHIGYKFESNNGSVFTLIYKDTKKDTYTLVSDLHGSEVVLNRRCVISGQFTDYGLPTVYGKGVVGWGKYKVSVEGVHTVNYCVWKGMLSRCYDEKHRRRLKYTQGEVIGDFTNFQKFSDWFYSRDNVKFYKSHDLCLDSDLLKPSEYAVYSKESCCLLPANVNLGIRLNNLANRNKELPLGVNFWKNNQDGSTTYCVKARQGGSNNEKTFYTRDIKEGANIYVKEKQKYINNLVDENYRIMCEDSIEACRNFWSKERLKLSGLYDYVEE